MRVLSFFLFFFKTQIALMKFIVHMCPFTCPRGQEECARTKKPKKSRSSLLPWRPILFRRLSSLMSATEEYKCSSEEDQQMALHTSGTGRNGHFLKWLLTKDYFKGNTHPLLQRHAFIHTRIVAMCIRS